MRNEKKDQWTSGKANRWAERLKGKYIDGIEKKYKYS